MLWLALAARDSGRAASEILGIKSPSVALDLDLACSMRLLTFDNDREIDRQKLFKQSVKEAVAELLGLKPADADTEIDISEDDYV